MIAGRLRVTGSVRASFAWRHVGPVVRQHLEVVHGSRPTTVWRGTILDREGVAIRVGHHCAQPVMDHFGVAATARASFALYNNHHDIQRLVDGIGRVREVFG